MDLSISSIAAGFVFGVMGMWVLKRGKDQGDLAWIGIGIALIAFSYFFSNPFLVWGIGAGLLWLAYKLR